MGTVGISYGGGIGRVGARAALTVEDAAARISAEIEAAAEVLEAAEASRDEELVPQPVGAGPAGAPAEQSFAGAAWVAPHIRYAPDAD